MMVGQVAIGYSALVHPEHKHTTVIGAFAESTDSEQIVIAAGGGNQLMLNRDGTISHRTESGTRVIGKDLEILSILKNHVRQIVTAWERSHPNGDAPVNIAGYSGMDLRKLDLKHKKDFPALITDWEIEEYARKYGFEVKDVIRRVSSKGYIRWVNCWVYDSGDIQDINVNDTRR